jgi:hypothetical protein
VIEATMPRLQTLIMLQASFAAASLGYLFISAWRQSTTGEPLSAAPLVPSILLFVLYGACLLLPRFGRIGWYRIAMFPAIVLFGGGGVVGNVLRYVEGGLEQYATFGAWALAVAINGYGTVLNIVAGLGLFWRDARQ